MIQAFEDPSKKRMREAARIAVDQAGFTIAEPLEKVAIAGAELVGGLRGDLQSVDRQGARTFYYLRPGSDDAVPAWIANLARASHAVEVGAVYLVVHGASDKLKESCIDSGTGLLVLTEDGVFDIVVDYSTTRPRSLAAATADRIKELRRALESRVDLTREDIKVRYSHVAPHIPAMDGDAADRYKDGFESEFREIDDWGESMSRRVDGLGPRSSPAELSEVESLISNGPPKPVMS